MSYYTPRKGVVNRYWKRPKPRVYECNIRDAERFYQQSYKDYLEAKEYAAKRAAEDRNRIGDDSSGRWTIRRTNSLIDNVIDPLNRDSSGYNSSTRNSYLSSGISSRQYGDDGFSSSFRSSSISNSRKTPDSDMASIEDRLQKLQKLRSELGLPSSELSGGTAKVTFASPPATSTSSRRISPDVRERRGKTVETSSSFSSSRTGRSYASDMQSDPYGDSLTSSNERSSRFKSKYSYEDTDDIKPSERSSRFKSKLSFDDNEEVKPSERSSRFKSKYSHDEYNDFKPKQNGIASSYSSDDADKFSFKSSLKSEKKYDLDDDSFSYKPKSKSSGDSKSFRSSRNTAAAEDNDIEDYDADAFLSNIKKKFPTSDEILERIKKMDSDM